MGIRTFLRSLTEFSETSTFHGVPQIVARKRHFSERIFWIIMFLLSIGGAVRLCLMNWERYIASPTVVSLEKDYKNWFNPFPAATGCFTVRVDEDAAQEYIQSKWSVSEEDEKYEYYMDFLKAVSNISYFTMSNFTRFQNDRTLDNIDLLDLAIKIHPPVEGDLISYDIRRQLEWTMISTEYGLCYTTNAKSAPLFAISKVSNKTIFNSNNLLKCHYLNGMCYARFDSDPHIPVNYFVHSPYEVIHTTTTPPLYLPEKSEKEVSYDMQETSPSPSLRKLSVSQRQCRFYDEPEYNDIPVYSTGVCNMLCRYKEALKKCGCRPFFYHKLAGKICDINGMVCLAKFTSLFTKSADDMGCKCVQPCWVITYIQQSIKSNIWTGGYFDQRVTLRWALLHPRTRYQRDVLFGFEDLVVSFGGTASLCFGMSFLSIIEVVFFFIKKLILATFSFCCNFGRNKNKIKTISIYEQKEKFDYNRHAFKKEIKVLPKKKYDFYHQKNYNFNTSRRIGFNSFLGFNTYNSNIPYCD